MPTRPFLQPTEVLLNNSPALQHIDYFPLFGLICKLVERGQSCVIQLFIDIKQNGPQYPSLTNTTSNWPPVGLCVADRNPPSLAVCPSYRARRQSPNCVFYAPSTSSLVDCLFKTCSWTRTAQATSSCPHSKRKSKTKSVHIVSDKGEKEPSQPVEDTIIHSMFLHELYKEFTRQTDESILTWMLWIWDSTANETNLDGGEARQLGSLSWDVVIDQKIGKKKENLSLWRQLLSNKGNIPLQRRPLCAARPVKHYGARYPVPKRNSCDGDSYIWRHYCHPITGPCLSRGNRTGQACPELGRENLRGLPETQRGV